MGHDNNQVLTPQSSTNRDLNTAQIFQGVQVIVDHLFGGNDIGKQTTMSSPSWALTQVSGTLWYLNIHFW